MDTLLPESERTSTALLVTVDTEEDGAWDGDYRAGGHTVENVAGVERFQAVCNRFGVRPTYLVDTPVIEDDSAVERLGRFQEAGLCEIGAHLHPWCAPPFEEPLNRRNSFMCNLSEDLQRAKLIRLTESLEHRFGKRPTSFRAGRYGLDARGAAVLVELGYVVDSSVISFTDYSPEGGPDFRTAPYQPYYPAGDDLCVVSGTGSLLEMPVSVGFSGRRFAQAQAAHQLITRPRVRPFRLAGILDRLNLVRRIKFSPEQSDAVRMKQLIDAYRANAAPAMVMMLHSSSLVPGGSPYVHDAACLEQLYQALADVLEYCMGRHAMVPQTLTEFADAFVKVRQ